jgi:putative protease
VRFARDLGCDTVVLAREVPVREIERIKASFPIHGTLAVPGSQVTSAVDAGAALPALEVFVHGALCVAYSGQCLTSESLGGRSANRGVCAQACRLPYELIADGRPVELGDRRYLLSPQDLAGLELLPDLILAGVASLKIEGRLKTPEYVAGITGAYRRALDDVCAALSVDTPDDGPPVPDQARRMARAASRANRYDFEMAFSRGLHTGWLEGVNNQALVHGRFGKKRGVFLGLVTRVEGDLVHVRLEGALKPGDGVVFDAGRPDLDEEGGRVYELRSAGSDRGGQPPEMVLGFGRGDVNPRRIQPGDRVWKTSDPELERRLRNTYAGIAPRHQRPLEVAVHGRAGTPLSVEFRDDLGHVVLLNSVDPLETAARAPLTEERLREQLGRLGGTPFNLGRLRNQLEGPVILRVSELNRIRREAVARIEALRALPPRWTLNPTGVTTPTTGTENRSARPQSSASPREIELIVLVRNLAQLDVALEVGVRVVYCEFEDPKKYREAVARFRAARHPANPPARSSIFVAPPRVFKSGEEWTLRHVRASDADGVLVRNYDHLEFFRDWRRVGDFSLNIANHLAAEYFMSRHGLEHLTASYDLNPAELEALLASAPPEWFEITLHQHMPMFHMEHCVFCAFLSQGTDYTNCGRPCDRREVRLRDRAGAEHPVKADAGCRNTVFNALAQTGAEQFERFLKAGARRFRLEFLDETPETVRETIRSYRQLFRGEISGAQLWRRLKVGNQLGVTRGR